jgi:hypothetical protein
VIDRLIHHCVILDMMAVERDRAHHASYQHLPLQEEEKTGTDTEPANPPMSDRSHAIPFFRSE